LTHASSDAIDLWHSLTPAAGRQVVTWAAEAVERGWRSWRRRLGEGVLAVGSGPREAAVPGSKKRRRLLPRKPALLVLVMERWRRRTTFERPNGRRETSPADLEAGAVPPYVTLRVPRRLLVAGPRPSRARGSVTIAVPTDVVAVGRRVRFHGGAAPQRLRVVGTKPPAVSGTACVFVRDVRTDERFLVGCHHVLRRSGATKDGRPDRQARVFVTDADGAATEIGAPAGHVTFCWREKASVDAALVRLTAVGTSWVASPEFRAFWRKTPAFWVRSAAELDATVASGAKTRLFTSAGVHVLANPRRFFRYPVALAKRRIPLAEVNLWETRPATAAGDSGGAALCGNALVGMYLAGDGLSAVTLPPWLWLGAGIKPFHLDLAEPGS
jgi:hypothetical protein